MLFDASIFNLFGLNSLPLVAQSLWMSDYIHKNLNVTVLMYHFVFPAKYRRIVFDNSMF
jgi:hypothetical protein